MADYIEKEALPQKRERGFFMEDDFNAGWNACLYEIEKLPVADAIEVVHGKWIWDGYVYDMPWQCSVCRGFNEINSNFCPNCGAKMDEKEEHFGGK